MSSGHPDRALIPGEETKIGTALVDTTTAAVQNFAPINKIHKHLCAFHCYADDMSRQVEAHHFCSHQNGEVQQCLIYDSSESDARLIGVEYIVSENLFMTLADEEKCLWHSHEYEVKSGVLFMPGRNIPGVIQRRDLDNVCKTYGKVFHFWQVDKGDSLPLGIPQLMVALTRDGQLKEELARDVEKRFGMSFEMEREKRTYMVGPQHGVHPMANGRGKGLKTELRESNAS